MPRTQIIETDPSAKELISDDLITLVGLLLESASGMERRIDATLRAEAGMPITTFEVLIRLVRTPGQRLRAVDLGNGLAMTTGGVTRLVDRLEAQGLVQRARDDADRRAVWIELTETGERAVLDALPSHNADLAATLGQLDHKDQVELARLLHQVRDLGEGPHTGTGHHRPSKVNGTRA